MLKTAFVVGTLTLAALAGQMTSAAETRFYCNLKALTASERSEHLQLSARLAESIVDTVELPDGYAFQLDRARMSLRDLATWSDFERRCCPFFDFALEMRRENGPLTLRLTGRDGVKVFIQSEMKSGR
jgi:hypothetical protein